MSTPPNALTAADVEAMRAAMRKVECWTTEELYDFAQYVCAVDPGLVRAFDVWRQRGHTRCGEP